MWLNIPGTKTDTQLLNVNHLKQPRHPINPCFQANNTKKIQVAWTREEVKTLEHLAEVGLPPSWQRDYSCFLVHGGIVIHLCTYCCQVDIEFKKRLLLFCSPILFCVLTSYYFWIVLCVTNVVSMWSVPTISRQMNPGLQLLCSKELLELEPQISNKALAALLVSLGHNRNMVGCVASMAFLIANS